MQWLDVRWYTFRPPDKRRPVVILTRPRVLASIDKIVVAGVTTTVRELPTEVRLVEADGLPRECVINFDNIFTVPRERLMPEDTYITTLSTDLIPLIRNAMLHSLNLY